MIVPIKTDSGIQYKTEIRATKIGGSNYFLVPAEYMKRYDVDKYVWYAEISNNGKTMTYKKMRIDEKKVNPNG